MPPLPNRRNAELFLLGFAAVITTVALLHRRGQPGTGPAAGIWRSTRVAYLALFARRAPGHPALRAVRRSAAAAGRRAAERPWPGDDSSPRPRRRRAIGDRPAAAQRQPADAVDARRCRRVLARRDLPHAITGMLARYGYVCGLTGLILLVIPAVLPPVDVGAERREDLDSSCRASRFSPPSSPRSCC